MEMTPNQTIERLKVIEEYLETTVENERLKTMLNDAIVSAIQYIIHTDTEKLFSKDY